MRAELIGHFKACMTEIYLHIDARMADHIRTHPYADRLPEFIVGRFHVRAESEMQSCPRSIDLSNSILSLPHPAVAGVGLATRKA